MVLLAGAQRLRAPSLQLCARIRTNNQIEGKGEKVEQCDFMLNLFPQKISLQSF